MKNAIPFATLARDGLNLQAIFNLRSLPDEINTALQKVVPNLSNYSQLILFGHGGQRMWSAVQEEDTASDNPIDDFSIHQITTYLEKGLTGRPFEFIYPGDRPVGLQQLGTLAGWHHTSLLRIGINETWGTWFAYRAAVLADSDYTPSAAIQSPAPCSTCVSQECIAVCPAGAVRQDGLQANDCFEYRKAPGSLCKDKCLARYACPVAADRRYSDEQISYHYSLSMKAIERMDEGQS